MPVIFTCPAALAGWELLVAEVRANWRRDVHFFRGCGRNMARSPYAVAEAVPVAQRRMYRPGRVPYLRKDRRICGAGLITTAT
jgi:hypothetical protein